MERQRFFHRSNHSSYSTVRLDDASVIEGSHLTIYGNNSNIKVSKSTIYGNDNIINGSDIQVFGHNNDIRSNYLIIEGNENVVKGHDANVNGNENHVTGRYAIVHGDANFVSGDDSKTNGNENSIIGRWTSTVGDYNNINGKRAHVNGNDNSVNSSNSKVIGNHNRILGQHAIVQGDSNIVDGDDSKVEGYHNTINGRWCIVEGNRNKIDGKHAFAMGDNNTVCGDNANATGNNNTINGIPSTLAQLLEETTFMEPPRESAVLDRIQQDASFHHRQSEHVAFEVHWECSQMPRQQTSIPDGLDLEDEMALLWDGDFGGDDENFDLSANVDTSMHDAWSMELENGVSSMLSSIGGRTPLQPFSLFSVQPFSPVQEEEQFRSTHQQVPITLSLRGEDKEIQDENDGPCCVCYSNTAIVVSDCCGKITTCIKCSRKLYEGKSVGQVSCPNCRGTVSHVTRVLP